MKIATYLGLVVRRVWAKKGILFGSLLGATLVIALRLGRASERHQYIAVGQSVEHARVIQTLGKAVDRQPLGGLGRFTSLPANRLGDFHRRKALRIRRGKGRVGSRRRLDREIRGVGARNEVQKATGDQNKDGDSDCEFAKNSHTGRDKRATRTRQQTCGPIFLGAGAL